MNTLNEKDLLTLLGEINGSINRLPEIPTDGDFFTISKYMEGITKSHKIIYRRYLNHLQYFTGLFDLKGKYDFNKLVPTILRQAIEFGKIGLTILDDKLLVFNPSKVTYDVFGNINEIQGVPVSYRFSYGEKHKTILKLKPNKCAILYSNHMGLPFIYFWGEVLQNIEHLSQAAITGSIASIKKFNRKQYNNSSMISKIENASFLDPTKPFITTIAKPKSYYDIENKGEQGDVDRRTMGNEVEFTSVSDDTKNLWDNLKAYMEFEYFQLNRRINTNKKSERNISKEIDTEVINFDILDQEFRRELLLFKEQCKRNLNLDFEVLDIVSETYNEEVETNYGGENVLNKQNEISN